MVRPTSADILAILSGGIRPRKTFSFKAGFLTSFKFATRLRTLFLYFDSVLPNSSYISAFSQGQTILLIYGMH